MAADDHDVCTLDELRRVLPAPPHADAKVLPALDEHCRHFIAHSPFVVIASRDAAGNMDVSPKGDPPGFVQVLDERTLAIPDRPGNHRADTFGNVLEVPQVALLFLVPGEDLTLRVMGEATISEDPALLEAMAVGGRVPKLALRIAVHEAFLHCGKAPKRAHLWDPDAQVPTGTIPKMGEMLHDQLTWKDGQAPPVSRDDLTESIEQDYRTNVY